MLLSPTLAFAKTSQEIWIDQVQEIYPHASRRTATIAARIQPRRRAIQRLRAMQAQSIFGYVKDQWLNLVDLFSLPVRVLANVNQATRTSLYLRNVPDLASLIACRL